MIKILFNNVNNVSKRTILGNTQQNYRSPNIRLRNEVWIVEEVFRFRLSTDRDSWQAIGSLRADAMNPSVNS